MVFCTKIYVQCGTESASVYTMLLQNKKQESLLQLGHLAVVLLGKRSTGVDLTHSTSLCHVAQVLQLAHDMHKNNANDPITSCHVVEPQGLAVSGINVRVDSDSNVLLGTAVILQDQHHLNTDTPVIHTETVYNGVPVQVTTLLGKNAVHTRNVSHFIASSDTKCVNVRSLQLNRRCESNVMWPPMLSHFSRRVRSNAVHQASFCNLGLEVQNTKQLITPLYDVLKSGSGEYVLFSIFI